MLQPVRDLAHR